MQRIKLAGRAGAREAYRFLLFPGACSRAVGNLSPAALRPAHYSLQPATLQFAAWPGSAALAEGLEIYTLWASL